MAKKSIPSIWYWILSLVLLIRPKTVSNSTPPWEKNFKQGRDKGDMDKNMPDQSNSNLDHPPQWNKDHGYLDCNVNHSNQETKKNPGAKTNLKISG
jgi:hypothetical protein